jgi:hypothetical protein
MLPLQLPGNGFDLLFLMFLAMSYIILMVILQTQIALIPNPIAAGRGAECDGRRWTHL